MPDHARQVVAAASPVLELNLVLCRSVDNFEVILASERVRGYIVGFFDGAVQAAGVEFSRDKQFFTYLGLGHELVLQKHLDNPSHSRWNQSLCKEARHSRRVRS